MVELVVRMHLVGGAQPHAALITELRRPAELHAPALGRQGREGRVAGGAGLAVGCSLVEESGTRCAEAQVVGRARRGKRSEGRSGGFSELGWFRRRSSNWLGVLLCCSRREERRGGVSVGDAAVDGRSERATKGGGKRERERERSGAAARTVVGATSFAAKASAIS